MGITLNNEQLYCCMDMEHWYYASTKQLYQISGAAGTGKTTLVLYLIDQLGLELEEVLFVAYMGKAATQLARHGLPAKTIHSAIYHYEMVPVIDKETGKKVYEKDGRVKKRMEFVLRDHLKKKIKLIVVDEGGMVPENIAKDLMSFGLPIVVLGDLNQLPPVFGSPYFLQNPDTILTQIMRQSEGNPIVWLSQEILAGRALHPGVYGSSAVLRRSDLTDFLFKNTDIVITERNNIRTSVNNYYREYLKGFKRLDRPYVGEKVICRKNNWDLTVGDGIYLTNGLTGWINDVDMSSFNTRTIKLDFLPDFVKRAFVNIPVSYHHMFSPDEELSESRAMGEQYLNKMEFAYAITTHSSQGSQWNKVLFLEDEDGIWGKDIKRRILYTAITRAIDGIQFVLNY